MRYTLFIVMMLLSMHSTYSQSVDTSKKASKTKDEKYWQDWLKDLYEVGVGQKGESLKITPEVEKVVKDEKYRSTIYPAKYTWPVAMDLMKNLELKIAFWHLINLYSESDRMKNLVMQALLPFDKHLEMDKIMISSFYTYGMIDPTATTVKDGKIEILRPDIIENKFNNVKQIIETIISNRPKKSGKK